MTDMAALERLALRLGGRIEQRLGDVPCLALPNGLEVCNETGTFDVWGPSRGRGGLAPVGFDLSETAVHVLAAQGPAA